MIAFFAAAPLKSIFTFVNIYRDENKLDSIFARNLVIKMAQIREANMQKVIAIVLRILNCQFLLAFLCDLYFKILNLYVQGNTTLMDNF